MKNKIDDFNLKNHEVMLKSCMSKINSLKLELEQFNNYDKKYIETQEELIEQFEIKKKNNEIMKKQYEKKVSIVIKLLVIAALLVSVILVICFTSPISLGLAATIITSMSIISVIELQKADVKLKIMEGEISIFNKEIETANYFKNQRLLKQESLAHNSKDDLISLIEYYESIIYEILENENLVETEYVKEVRKVYCPKTENSIEQKKLIKVKHNEV